MRNSRSLSLQVFAAVLFGILTRVQAADELTIAQGGKTQAIVAVSPEAGTWEKRAAEDLVKYIEQMSGARPALAAFCDMLVARPDLRAVHALDGANLLPKVSTLRWQRVTRFDNRGLSVDLLRLQR